MVRIQVCLSNIFKVFGLVIIIYQKNILMDFWAVEIYNSYKVIYANGEKYVGLRLTHGEMSSRIISDERILVVKVKR